MRELDPLDLDRLEFLLDSLEDSETPYKIICYWGEDLKILEKDNTLCVPSTEIPDFTTLQTLAAFWLQIYLDYSRDLD